MASRNLMIGTGAALAGLGGIAAAAVTTNAPETQPASQAATAPVETQTVIVRKVEHRVKRIKAKHPHRVAAAPAAAPVQAVAQPATTPVVRAAPAPAAVLRNVAPIRTRASGGGHGTGGDDAGEGTHHGPDDSGESNDD